MKARRIAAGMAAAIFSLSAMGITAFAEEEIEFDAAEILDEGDEDKAVEFEETEEETETADDAEGGTVADDTDDETDDETDTEEEETRFVAEFHNKELFEEFDPDREGYINTYVPAVKLADFPDDADIQVTLDYLTTPSYQSKEEIVVGDAHEVKTADIALVIDETGSMGDEIANVKKNLKEFVQKLQEKNIDFKLSVVTYRDWEDDGPEYTVFHDFNGSKWTNDVEAVITCLDNIRVGGGSWIDGEDPLYAFELLCTESDWYKDADADKFVFLLTDEYYKENKGSSRTMDEWITFFNQYNISCTMVTDNSHIDRFTDLYQKTGGEFYDINGDYSEMLSNFAAYVNEKISHTVRYESWNVAPCNFADGSILNIIDTPTVNGEKVSVNTDGTVSVPSGEGTVTFTLSGADAKKLFAANEAGYTNFGLTNWGVYVNTLRIEAVDRAVAPDPEPQKFEFPVYNNPREKVDVSDVHRYTVSPEINIKETENVVKATGGVFDAADPSPVTAAAGVVGALAVIGAGVLVVLNKRKHN